MKFLPFIDGFIIGFLIYYLIEFFFGDKPLIKLIKLLSGVSSGIAYFFFCAYLMYGDIPNDIGLIIPGIFIFGPVILLAIIWIINFMFKNK